MGLTEKVVSILSVSPGVFVLTEYVEGPVDKTLIPSQLDHRLEKRRVFP
jgi:hypothetical protein